MLPDTQLRCSTAHGVLSVLARSTVAEPLAVCSARVLRGSPWPRDAGGTKAPDYDCCGYVHPGRPRSRSAPRSCGGCARDARAISQIGACMSTHRASSIHSAWCHGRTPAVSRLVPIGVWRCRARNARITTRDCWGTEMGTSPTRRPCPEELADVTEERTTKLGGSRQANRPPRWRSTRLVFRH